LFSDPYLQAFESIVRQLGIAAYLCGGTVRDLILGRQFRDVDVVLSDRVFDAAELFHSKLNAPYFILDEERKVARVVCKNGNWDFTGFRNHTIEGDLRKRDFTINALAVRWDDFFPDRKTQPVIDPFGGLRDLNSGLIRPVSDESIREDPLRLLRAYRIAAELRFSIDPAVLADVEKLHAAIQNVAAERVVEELDRVLALSNSGETWRALGATQLFDSLFPEMQPMKGCDQRGYHHLDVWSHSVLALENLERFLPEIPRHFPKYAPRLQDYLVSIAQTLDRIRLLKWAALLHDIGKPETQQMREDGAGYRFHGHDHAGAAIAERLLQRLKFARKDAQLICLMIEHHLRPLQLFNQNEKSSDDFRKFFRAVGAEAVGVLLISYADMNAARGPLANPDRDSQFLEMMQKMFAFYFEEYYPAVNTPELIKGRDVMAVLQMPPGPLIGELLKEVREAQLDGRLHNRDEALDFARNWLKTNRQDARAPKN
jgi:poly(A) polymerase